MSRSGVSDPFRLEPPCADPGPRRRGRCRAGGQVTTYQYDGLNRRTFAGFGTTVSGGTMSYSSSITALLR